MIWHVSGAINGFKDLLHAIFDEMFLTSRITFVYERIEEVVSIQGT